MYTKNSSQFTRHFLFLKVVLLACLIMSGGLLSQAQAAELKGEMVAYTPDGVEGYLALPKGNKARPAVILIHEWWGLNDEIKGKADKFAKAGYVALAVDLYNGEATVDPAVARGLATAVRGDMPAAFENLEAAVSTLQNHPRVKGDRIASVGWCFGGGWSYQMALNNLNVKASVIYYGAFNPADDLSIMRAEIMGHFAENDRGISVDNVKEFQVKLKTLNGDHEVYIYPNTSHGFASRKETNPVYDKDAAELADKRTLGFLKDAL